MTNKWLAAVLALAFAATLTPEFAEAKRLGGGKPMGMQRQAPAQTAPQSTPPTPAQPAAPVQPGSTVSNPATAGAAAAAAAPAKRSWMGPIAGLAAGLGLAALASHFGFGEGLANVMMLALLALLAFVAIRFVMGRLAAGRAQPALAGAGGNADAVRPSWPAAPPAASAAQPAAQPIERAAAPVGGDNLSVTGVPLAPIGADVAAAAPSAGMASSGPQLPDGFDLPAFERAAKLIFIRMQAANDAADLEDLREFTTPEMFAAARLDIQDRGGVAQQTDVETVEAKLIDFTQEPTRQVASVRFHGRVREEKDAPAVAFDEVWHLVKPLDGSRAWAIAGIQQPS